MEISVKQKINKNLFEAVKDKIIKNKKLKSFIAVNLLISFDFVAFFLSLTFISLTLDALYFLFDLNYQLVTPFTLVSNYWWVFLIILIFMFYEGLYTKRLPFWEETKRILKVIGFSIIFASAIITILKLPSNTPVIIILLFLAYSSVIFPISRSVGKRLMYKTSIGRDNVIIIGAGAGGIQTAKAILNEANLGYKIVGFLDDDPQKIGKKIEVCGKKYKVFGRISSFNKFINLLEISTVVVAIPSLKKDKLIKLTNNVHKYSRKIIFVPDLQGIALLNTELNSLFTEQLFLMELNNNLKSTFNQLLKRSFDIIVSISLLPILLPIIGIIGILIKLDSKGSIFFIQERLGKDGKTFKCIKFRTMYEKNEEILRKYLKQNPKAKEEWEKFKKLKCNDPRITKIGKWLRKTSLDELPQIFNVLKGEMSLVGPRPYLFRELQEMKEYKDTILLSKPGITGLWQVSGRNDLEFDYRLKLDTWYVLNWSLWLDVVILLKTVKVVLKGEGAY
jgi:undecaprenyl-phosphate galactose phosphotransferase